jgi:hypothetical protein
MLPGLVVNSSPTVLCAVGCQKQVFMNTSVHGISITAKFHTYS